ncbi:HD domain-containing phosphohydrolase [Azoarcus sp. KH32C]|uniref:HD domain-containing phosphohydrolase n=1 Tax=Azoarcus sp. KH32C TaxID=748247 RepID=UPI000238675D|nr:HD domain-containing phosphohydrolase [Azoarcus sp. KH32C]BAL25289.1 response regulator protein [Azoarcus sp. KH32C]
MSVVIVDDTPTTLELMRAFVLRLEGREPVTFTDPGSGLAWCLENDPDLIIVDYMMPNIDGLEFIRQIRREPRHDSLPILMVTADHEKSIRYAALNEGATDFLNKPVDRMEFLARAKNMLALRRSQQALADRASSLAEAVKRAVEEIHDREHETIVRLARAAECRDPETGAHILRMAHYAQLIAGRMGLPPDFQEMLLRAAPMHDVGKLGTPDHILLKPGRHTPEEFEVMKQHTLIGYEILRESSSPAVQLAASIALHHHEKFDGTGYPRRLAGNEIPIEGRIVAVADVFDALTSERPYKKAWTFEAARAYLRENRGKHFDPSCVDAFLALWERVIEINRRFRDEEDAVST